jgi:hypothetical protein
MPDFQGNPDHIMIKSTRFLPTGKSEEPEKKVVLRDHAPA